MEWTGARYADGPTAEVRTRIAASPERVWELVSDVGLMPRLSTELRSVEWLDGTPRPAVGARFVGRSEHASFGAWETTSYVVECAAPRVFAWAVEDPERPSAVWRFSLAAADDGGTELTQWMRMGPGRSGLSYAIDRMPEKEQKIVYVRMREFEQNMAATLDAIKKLAEGGASGDEGAASREADA
ncbi:SRPBCC family protein [Streptomyces sp. NPDC058471]|uniref:SRPBCC family protein n=1 Tax=Streptomyces sp. NPDC058471 TaxID=3346516 RepID=UPI00364A48D7